MLESRKHRVSITQQLLIFFYVCVRTQEATSQPDDGKVADNQDVKVNSADKFPTKLSLNHKELIEMIRKEKEQFIQEKKSQVEAEKQAKIEQLVNSSKVDDTGAKGITGGEPSDEITRERRNFIKKVCYYIN